MEVKIKRLKGVSIIISLMVCLTIIFGYTHVQAAYSKDNSDEIMHKYKRTYSVTPILSEDKLINRAIIGIDDFKKDTGITVDASFSASSDIVIKDEYNTSQLVGKYYSNGELYKEYIISNIVKADIRGYGYDPVTANNCTIRTIIYVVWNSNLTLVSFRTSTTSVIGGSPVSLIMHNQVYTGWDTDKTYFNSNTITTPNGLYSLTSPYMGEIGDSYASYIWCIETVYFQGGATLEFSVELNPGGYLPPEV